MMEDDCRRLRQFEGKNGCTVRSWVRIIAIQRTLDHLRRRKVHMSLDSVPSGADPDAPRPEPAADGADPLETLLRGANEARRGQFTALAEDLRTDDRLLLELDFTREMDALAIAAALNLSRGAIYTRKNRLLQRLRKLARDAELIESAP